MRPSEMTNFGGFDIDKPEDRGGILITNRRRN